MSTVSEDSRIRQIRGRAVPVRGDDIDTDRIIPARFLRCVTFEGLGEHAFEDDRRASTGVPHPFDRPEFQGATILVANSNFGCGSSREHAPQSLLRWGIRGLVAESFAEIFFGNCVALGVPCVTLPRDDVRALQAAVGANPKLEVTIDVESLDLRYDGRVLKAGLPAGAQGAFLSGRWDSASLLFVEPEAIDRVAASLPYCMGAAKGGW
jgi:3-isopropylmalate/(R)-2-methylmalate dehydratase small subunit